jgi:hypothetical protein
VQPSDSVIAVLIKTSDRIAFETLFTAYDGVVLQSLLLPEKARAYDI